MCNAVAEIRAEEREKTRAEDMKILRDLIYNLVSKCYLAPEHAAESLEITVNELQTDMEKAGYIFPVKQLVFS